jgi:U3 small nucleolar RNA-associated protein 22
MSLMHASQDAEYAKTASVDIGLVMEPSQAARVVEYGPAADQATEVQAFKSFWGSKAETRRFKDGRILESVVWDADTPSERTNIWKQIVAHILQHHLQIPPTKISFFAGLYDPFLVEAPQARHLLYTVDPSTTGFGPLISAFDSFAKDLKSLEGLPLSIKNVSAMSEGLRYASVFVPGQIKVKALSHASSAMSYLPAQEVLISFEGSGKWPEDLEALQKVKSAFLVRLGDLYRSTNHGSRCDMFFDIQASPSSGPCALDIMTLEGFVFRVRIHHERERQLLQDALLEEESLNSERKDHLMSYYRTFVARPAHHAAMSALQHRHTSLSSTIRIVKRWMASHLLLPHIAVELVELLCAYVYLDRRSVYDVPASGSCGFARVLALLATWKWREEPLLVPLFTSSSADAASTRIRFPLDLEKQAAGLFANMRKMDPAVSRSAWVIATEEQLSGQVFGSPSRIIAARLQELARVCSLALADATATGTPEVEVRVRISCTALQD